MLNDKMEKDEVKITEQDKIIALFKFVRELNKLKQKAILDIKGHIWTYALSDLPDDPDNIKVFYCDRVDEESENDAVDCENILLSVHKPKFHKCPEPDAALMEWLMPGWEQYSNKPQVKGFIELPQKKTQRVSLFVKNLEEPVEKLPREFFIDNEERVKKYNNWLAVRSEWAARQKIIKCTRDLFSKLYSYYFELQRESETEEIIVASGMLLDTENPAIHHPVLIRRVKIDYDVSSDVLSIVDTDAPSELYYAVFQEMEDINNVCLKESPLTKELQEKDYHPLDRYDTPDFLKRLVSMLSDNSHFSENGEVSDSRLQMSFDPCFIVRKRFEGASKAIDDIITDIEETGAVPDPIGTIASGGYTDIPEATGEDPIEERLAAVGGESIDILFSKEANKEQLNIAKRIENYSAVLVQGPPGTGKTHTIANLMGHLLAQGKSVLVTSHTKKALKVLKEKVAPGLQSLCVSVLDDSNLDVEQSVEGILSRLSETTSYDLKREMESIAADRREVIRQLADVRRRIYAVINQECNCIVLNGESISPSAAATFVVEHMDDLSYIPGRVSLYTPLPLSNEQLADLYRSNEDVTTEDEMELETDLPNPADIMSPGEFAAICDRYSCAFKQICDTENKNSWNVKNNSTERNITITGAFGELEMSYPEPGTIEDLKQYTQSFGKIERWMKVVAVDGKSGKAHSQRWHDLIDKIEKTCNCSEKYMSVSLGKQLIIDKNAPLNTIKTTFEKMLSVFSEKGKISKFAFMVHKEYEQALAAVTINGKQPDSADDCELTLRYIELHNARKQCADVWNDLLASSDVLSFYELDKNEPERIAANMIPLIKRYLDWYNTDYEVLIDKLTNAGIFRDALFQTNVFDSELVKIEKIFMCVEQIIPEICDVCIAVVKSSDCCSSLSLQKNKLISGKRGSSNICRALVSALDEGNCAVYANAYAALENMYEKYDIQHNRDKALKILEPVASQWADAIRMRRGIHGHSSVPDDIDDAWKWKQLYGIIEEITKRPFAELQSESLRLSREYREITAEYAEKSGWYHMLRTIETNVSMKMALVGWALNIKKIGKGKGKKAPMLKAEARKLMAQCQQAVPCWIMPINKALESLNPRVNKFDVVIIDEASQSDISSLAILYMGKKLIIVGDDQQVSPMAIGIEDKKIMSLQEEYLEGKIPNAHLYTAQTSIYDIAKTAFQPLMLREHFRCVPEIIGFSNMLSYNGKIKPLRDTSNSVLLPAVVNYRVDGGQRDHKFKKNLREAETIVALMQACFDQPEYDGKSFGVISMLGDDQVKLIQMEIERKLKPQDIIERKVLCGNSANFQGDERDVVFLSLVDSGTGDGPLNKMDYGPNDSYRKRYNVAASRARDQLWVVDSLDPANDLKPGDIRKTLIEYSLNPDVVHKEIKDKADSPFEVSVASALVGRGYHIVQQWKVGSYRLDMVAVYGKKKVAIECDGERWHSGEDKIREDMERQTILERLGWRFIRIRGSEFYRDSDRTIERVISELKDYGIEPEDTSEDTTGSRETDLLNRVKARAFAILHDANTEKTEQDGEQINVPKVTIDDGSSATCMQKPVAKVKDDDFPGQHTIFEMPIMKQQMDMKLDADIFIEKLKQHNIRFVDNRKQSGIVWIIYEEGIAKVVEDIINKFNYDASLERRGSIATENQPAWRVMM